jgi:periplasmic protein TonB
MRAAAPGAPGGGAEAASAVPRYRRAPAPEYPLSARRLRQEGVVLLAVDVSAGGRPTRVAVKRTSGVPSLDRAAVRAVRHWSFEPARTAGVPVDSRVEIPIRFRLTE